MFWKGGTNVPLEPLASSLPLPPGSPSTSPRKHPGSAEQVDTIPMPRPLSSWPSRLLSMMLSLCRGHLPNGSWIVTTRSLDGGRHTAARW